MKFMHVFSLLMLSRYASGHYWVEALIVDGKKLENWVGVRMMNQDSKEVPLKDPMSIDFRCNRSPKPSPETPTVKAGTEIGAWWNARDGRGAYHPGPFQVYLYKVPEGKTAATYNFEAPKGWFKIHKHFVLCASEGNCVPQNFKALNFKIPKATPNGEYIVRFEQIAVHSIPESFVTCAQIKVEGGGSGQIEDKYLVQFPGAYSPTDPIFTYNEVFFNVQPKGSTCPYPGPELWTGESSPAPGGGIASVPALSAQKPIPPTPSPLSISKSAAPPPLKTASPSNAALTSGGGNPTAPTPKPIANTVPPVPPQVPVLGSGVPPPGSGAIPTLAPTSAPDTKLPAPTPTPAFAVQTSKASQAPKVSVLRVLWVPANATITTIIYPQGHQKPTQTSLAGTSTVPPLVPGTTQTPSPRLRRRWIA